MSRTAKIFLGLALATAIGVVAIAMQFNRFLHTPVSVGDSGTLFEIRSGMPFRRITDDLAAKGIISQPTLFRLYGRITGKAASVQAGEYHIPAGSTPVTLLDRFVGGYVQLYSFTIVEGWTFRELLEALADDAVVEASLAFEDWPGLLEYLSAETNHPEGLFLPETYRFPKGTRDIDVLRLSFDLMQKTLAEAWDGRDENLPLSSPYEALILASIIEKETALASERPLISGVFVRRLQQRMRLGTDPTVIYGIGVDFNGNLTRRDLRTDTPYNTYTRSGLPPTPIALPGLASIHAAVHPAPGTALYFVATGRGDGSHQFSDTKDQHDDAVQEFLARRRVSPGQR